MPTTIMGKKAMAWKLYALVEFRNKTRLWGKD